MITMRTLRDCLALILGLTLASVCPVGAAPVGAGREPRTAPVPFPDGVVAPDLRTAFVSNPEGGIQAVRLEDGKVLWTNDTCKGRPWIVAGRRLIARGERLTLLDAQEGKLLRQCDALDYPKVEVPDRCTMSFQLWNGRVVGDLLEARWYAVANIDRSKGRPFNFQGWTNFNKAAPVGTVKVNLDSGRIELQTDPKTEDLTAGLAPMGTRSDRQVPAGLPGKRVAVWQEYHKDQNGRITLLGDRLVGVAMVLEPVGAEYLKKVVLNAWNVKTGIAEPPVELVKDKALNIANIVLTEDHRHAGVVFSTSALTLYSLTDGKRVAENLRGIASPESAFVDGKRLFYTQLSGAGALRSPNVLRAIDLQSGKVVWECSLEPRSTVPLPP